MPAPQTLEPGDSRYPSVLRDIFGALLPPAISFIGNLDIMGEKGVGFCGSRQASECGIQTTSDCARQLGEAGAVVVSGYAPGVDMAAHEAALAVGGKTLIILAEGIGHFRIKKSIRENWDWKRVLVLSHYPSNAVWRADRAMERNKLIVGLSNAVIVVEARDKGGTLNAGFCALQMKRPLFVAVYDNMNGGKEGNEILLREGGQPLKKSKTSNRAKLESVFDALTQQH
jgi:DNA processing protein